MYTFLPAALYASMTANQFDTLILFDSKLLILILVTLLKVSEFVTK